MAADASSTPYTKLPSAPSVGRTHWRLVPLVLALGLGGHASTQALSAAEPSLYSHGVSPLAFSVLAIGPHVAACFMPTVWGDAFTRSARMALLLAPALLLIGQLLIFAALLKHTPELRGKHFGAIRFAAVGIGFVLFSASRAGLAVVQYAALARLLTTSSLVGALCTVVITTHAVGAAVQLLSPPLLGAGGLLALQGVLLLPAVVGVVAGGALGIWLPPPPAELPPDEETDAGEAWRAGPFAVRCKGCGKAVQREVPFVVDCEGCQRAARARWRARLAVLLLACWRSLTLGPLHSFAVLTNGFLVSHKLSMKAAGALVAFNGSASLFVLIPLALASAAAGTRAAHSTLRMLAGATLLALCSVATLAVLQEAGGRDSDWADPPPGERASSEWWASRLALLGIAAGSAAAPVLLHALVPLVAPPAVVARAYGVLESFYFVGLAASSLLMGAARQWAGGFRGSLLLLLLMLISSFAAITLLRRVVLSQEAAAARAALAAAAQAETEAAELARLRRTMARSHSLEVVPARGMYMPCDSGGDEDMGHLPVELLVRPSTMPSRRALSLGN